MGDRQDACPTGDVILLDRRLACPTGRGKGFFHPSYFKMLPSANYNRRFRKANQHQTRISIHKLVSFQLGSEQYAIPIERVQHVIKEFMPLGVLQNGIALVEYQNQTITVIELSNLFVSSQDSRERQYLIVCNLKPNSRLGIPIPEMPNILEVPADKFGQIPELYQKGDLHEAIERIIHTPDGKVVFYINLDKLITNLNSPS